MGAPFLPFFLDARSGLMEYEVDGAGVASAASMAEAAEGPGVEEETPAAHRVHTPTDSQEQGRTPRGYENSGLVGVDRGGLFLW